MANRHQTQTRAYRDRAALRTKSVFDTQIKERQMQPNPPLAAPAQASSNGHRPDAPVPAQRKRKAPTTNAGITSRIVAHFVANPHREITIDELKQAVRGTTDSVHNAMTRAARNNHAWYPAIQVLMPSQCWIYRPERLAAQLPPPAPRQEIVVDLPREDAKPGPPPGSTRRTVLPVLLFEEVQGYRTQGDRDDMVIVDDSGAYWGAYRL